MITLISILIVAVVVWLITSLIDISIKPTPPASTSGSSATSTTTLTSAGTTGVAPAVAPTPPVRQTSVTTSSDGFSGIWRFVGSLIGLILILALIGGILYGGYRIIYWFDSPSNPIVQVSLQEYQSSQSVRLIGQHKWRFESPAMIKLECLSENGEIIPFLCNGKPVLSVVDSPEVNDTVEGYRIPIRILKLTMLSHGSCSFPVEIW